MRVFLFSYAFFLREEMTEKNTNTVTTTIISIGRFSMKNFKYFPPYRSKVDLTLPYDR